MKQINVKSKQKDYKIIIKNDLLTNLREYLDVNQYYIIISDDNIPKTYVNSVKDSLSNHLFIDFPEGEKSKSFEQYERIISILQENNITKDANIVALGGGVTGDLVGFIASTYLRGVNYIQIPTSLLAQIDSSVGGKVAINTSKAKNSVGSFYPPSIVLIDPSTIRTLPERHFNNGMSEMIKYGMIYSKDLFNKILHEDVSKDLEYYIHESLLIKKYYVESDEYDTSVRQTLNFGHTYGHAYEAFYNYEKYLHGEGVALGMLEVCKGKKYYHTLLKMLTKYNLPTTDNATKEDLLPFVMKDKKKTRDYLNLILVDEIGKARIEKVRL